MQRAAAGGRTTRSRPSAARPGWDRYDGVIAIALAAATLLVHPVPEMLGHPYWLDEAWVAVLTRAPLSSLGRLTSSTPIGFVGLLRLVPGSGLQRGRLVVVGFAALGTVATYVLVRTFRWRRLATARFAAIVTALVVMLAPVSLVRNDLKPYTCDAFCALLLLATGAWVERSRTRGSLVGLAVVAVVAVPFSSTVLFVTVAVFAGVFAAALIERRFRRALEIVVAGAVTGGALAGYYFVAVGPNLNERLRRFWASRYPDGSLGDTLHFFWVSLSRLASQLAMPAAVFIALFVIGVVVLLRVRARAMAVTMPLLWVEMAVAGRLERYPFLDQRTSHFLLVASLAVVALGAVGIVGAAARLCERASPVLGTGVVGAVALALAVSFAVGVHGYVWDLHIPDEDVRAATLAAAERRLPHDVVLVSSSANFGLAYYWPHGHLTFQHNRSGQGFGAQVTGVGAIYVRSRRYADVRAALRAAVERLRRAPAGSRLYIVRTHLSERDGRSWQRAFDALHVVPQEVPVGSEPLLIVDQS